MKNILNKFNINSFTYIFILLSFFCGFIKNAIIIFFLIIIHEIGHVFFIKLFNYNIESINIYPFGGITIVNKLINTSIRKDILIAFGGVFFQLIFVNAFIYIFNFNEMTINLIKKYNYLIIFFNLLPIIPLDGSKVLDGMLNKLFPYKLACKIMIIISFLSIFIFFIYNYYYSVNNYAIITMLILYTFKYVKDFKYIYNKFLLERLLYDIPYKTINNNTKSLNELRREKKHYFKENNKYVSEKAKISKKFDKINII